MNLLQRIGAAFRSDGHAAEEVLPSMDAPVISRGNGTQINNSMTMQEFAAWVGSTDGSAPLDEKTSLTVSAIYAAVGLIAGTIAAIPFHVFEQTPDGHQRVDDPLWRIFNIEMAAGWNAAVAWEFLISSLLLHGNFFGEIKRTGGGLRAPEITGIEPIHPLYVDVRREPTTRRLVYIVHPDNTTQAGGARVIDQDDMIHVPGFGFDGLRGYSPLHLALREAGGVARATQQYSKAFFENGARPDFVLSADGKVTPEDVELIRQQWNDKHMGPTRAFRPAILSGGMKPHTISLPLEDAQMIATRQFQIEEIARIFGVPPFMIGHTEKTTSWGSGVEQMGIGFVKYTLQRHLTKIQTEFRRKCFPVGSTRFAEFVTAALERGDFKTQSEGFRIALGRAGEKPWMKVSEVRRLLNLPHEEGTDDLQPVAGSSAAPQEASQ